MRRVLFSLLFATLAGALVFGAAANLPVTSQDLGSGNDTVGSCDDAVTTAYNLVAADPATVDSVTVGDIAATCDGQEIYVVVYAGSTSLDSGQATYSSSGDGGSKTIDLPLDANANSIDKVVVTITG